MLSIAVVGAPFVGCASDESPSVETPGSVIPFDPEVGDGVDTEIERSENLNQDGDDA